MPKIKIEEENDFNKESEEHSVWLERTLSESYGIEEKGVVQKLFNYFEENSGESLEQYQDNLTALFKKAGIDPSSASAVDERIAGLVQSRIRDSEFLMDRLGRSKHTAERSQTNLIIKFFRDNPLETIDQYVDTGRLNQLFERMPLNNMSKRLEYWKYIDAKYGWESINLLRAMLERSEFEGDEKQAIVKLRDYLRVNRELVLRPYTDDHVISLCEQAGVDASVAAPIGKKIAQFGKAYLETIELLYPNGAIDRKAFPSDNDANAINKLILYFSTHPFKTLAEYRGNFASLLEDANVSPREATRVKVFTFFESKLGGEDLALLKAMLEEAREKGLPGEQVFQKLYDYFESNTHESLEKNKDDMPGLFDKAGIDRLLAETIGKKIVQLRQSRGQDEELLKKAQKQSKDKGVSAHLTKIMDLLKKHPLKTIGQYVYTGNVDALFSDSGIQTKKALFPVIVLINDAYDREDLKLLHAMRETDYGENENHAIRVLHHYLIDNPNELLENHANNLGEFFSKVGIDSSLVETIGEELVQLWKRRVKDKEFLKAALHGSYFSQSELPGIKKLIDYFSTHPLETFDQYIGNFNQLFENAAVASSLSKSADPLKILNYVEAEYGGGDLKLIQGMLKENYPDDEKQALQKLHDYLKDNRNESLGRHKDNLAAFFEGIDISQSHAVALEKKFTVLWKNCSLDEQFFKRAEQKLLQQSEQRLVKVLNKYFKENIHETLSDYLYENNLNELFKRSGVEADVQFRRHIFQPYIEAAYDREDFKLLKGISESNYQEEEKQAVQKLRKYLRDNPEKHLRDHIDNLPALYTELGISSFLVGTIGKEITQLWESRQRDKKVLEAALKNKQFSENEHAAFRRLIIYFSDNPLETIDQYLGNFSRLLEIADVLRSGVNAINIKTHILSAYGGEDLDLLKAMLDNDEENEKEAIQKLYDYLRVNPEKSLVQYENSMLELFSNADIDASFVETLGRRLTILRQNRNSDKQILKELKENARDANIRIGFTRIIAYFEAHPNEILHEYLYEDSIDELINKSGIGALIWSDERFVPQALRTILENAFDREEFKLLKAMAGGDYGEKEKQAIQKLRKYLRNNPSEYFSNHIDNLPVLFQKADIASAVGEMIGEELAQLWRRRIRNRNFFVELSAKEFSHAEQSAIKRIMFYFSTHPLETIDQYLSNFNELWQKAGISVLEAYQIKIEAFIKAEYGGEDLKLLRGMLNGNYTDEEKKAFQKLSDYLAKNPKGSLEKYKDNMRVLFEMADIDPSIVATLERKFIALWRNRNFDQQILKEAKQSLPHYTEQLGVGKFLTYFQLHPQENFHDYFYEDDFNELFMRSGFGEVAFRTDRLVIFIELKYGREDFKLLKAMSDSDYSEEEKQAIQKLREYLRDNPEKRLTDHINNLPQLFKELGVSPFVVETIGDEIVQLWLARSRDRKYLISVLQQEDTQDNDRAAIRRLIIHFSNHPLQTIDQYSDDLNLLFAKADVLRPGVNHERIVGGFVSAYQGRYIQSRKKIQANRGSTSMPDIKLLQAMLGKNEDGNKRQAISKLLDYFENNPDESLTQHASNMTALFARADVDASLVGSLEEQLMTLARNRNWHQQYFENMSEENSEWIRPGGKKIERHFENYPLETLTQYLYEDNLDELFKKTNLDQPAVRANFIRFIIESTCDKEELKLLKAMQDGNYGEKEKQAVQKLREYLRDNPNESFRNYIENLPELFRRAEIDITSIQTIVEEVAQLWRKRVRDREFFLSELKREDFSHNEVARIRKFMAHFSAHPLETVDQYLGNLDELWQHTEGNVAHANKGRIFSGITSKYGTEDSRFLGKLLNGNYLEDEKDALHKLYDYLKNNPNESFGQYTHNMAALLSQAGIEESLAEILGKRLAILLQNRNWDTQILEEGNKTLQKFREQLAIKYLSKWLKEHPSEMLHNFFYEDNLDKLFRRITPHQSIFKNGVFQIFLESSCDSEAFKILKAMSQGNYEGEKKQAIQKLREYLRDNPNESLSAYINNMPALFERTGISSVLAGTIGKEIAQLWQRRTQDRDLLLAALKDERFSENDYAAIRRIIIHFSKNPLETIDQYQGKVDQLLQKAGEALRVANKPNIFAFIQSGGLVFPTVERSNAMDVDSDENVVRSTRRTSNQVSSNRADGRRKRDRVENPEEEYNYRQPRESVLRGKGKRRKTAPDSTIEETINVKVENSVAAEEVSVAVRAKRATRSKNPIVDDISSNDENSDIEAKENSSARSSAGREVAEDGTLIKGEEEDSANITAQSEPTKNSQKRKRENQDALHGNGKKIRREDLSVNNYLQNTGQVSTPILIDTGNIPQVGDTVVKIEDWGMFITAMEGRIGEHGWQHVSDLSTSIHYNEENDRKFIGLPEFYENGKCIVTAVECKFEGEDLQQIRNDIARWRHDWLPENNAYEILAAESPADAALIEVEVKKLEQQISGQLLQSARGESAVANRFKSDVVTVSDLRQGANATIIQRNVIRKTGEAESSGIESIDVIKGTIKSTKEIAGGAERYAERGLLEHLFEVDSDRFVMMDNLLAFGNPAVEFDPSIGGFKSVEIGPGAPFRKITVRVKTTNNQSEEVEHPPFKWAAAIGFGLKKDEIVPLCDDGLVEFLDHVAVPQLVSQHGKEFLASWLERYQEKMQDMLDDGEEPFMLRDRPYLEPMVGAINRSHKGLNAKIFDSVDELKTHIESIKQNPEELGGGKWIRGIVNIEKDHFVAVNIHITHQGDVNVQAFEPSDRQGYVKDMAAKLCSGNNDQLTQIKVQVQKLARGCIAHSLQILEEIWTEEKEKAAKNEASIFTQIAEIRRQGKQVPASRTEVEAVMNSGDYVALPAAGNMQIIADARCLLPASMYVHIGDDEQAQRAIDKNAAEEKDGKQWGEELRRKQEERAKALGLDSYKDCLIDERVVRIDFASSKTRIIKKASTLSEHERVRMIRDARHEAHLMKHSREKELEKELVAVDNALKVETKEKTVEGLAQELLPKEMRRVNRVLEIVRQEHGYRNDFTTLRGLLQARRERLQKKLGGFESPRPLVIVRAQQRMQYNPVKEEMAEEQSQAATSYKMANACQHMDWDELHAAYKGAVKMAVATGVGFQVDREHPMLGQCVAAFIGYAKESGILINKGAQHLVREMNAWGKKDAHWRELSHKVPSPFLGLSTLLSLQIHGYRGLVESGNGDVILKAERILKDKKVQIEEMKIRYEMECKRQGLDGLGHGDLIKRAFLIVLEASKNDNPFVLGEKVNLTERGLSKVIEDSLRGSALEEGGKAELRLVVRRIGEMLLRGGINPANEIPFQPKKQAASLGKAAARSSKGKI